MTAATPDATRAASRMSLRRWTATRRYLGTIAAGNMVWEAAHLPLYSLWVKAKPAALAYTVLHCVLGDVLIAASALAIAIATIGRGAWTSAAGSYRAVACLAVAFGLGYTVFSEWLNVTVRQGWAYSPWMPLVPPFGTGLSPLLQWVVVPLLAFWFAGRRPAG